MVFVVFVVFVVVATAAATVVGAVTVMFSQLLYFSSNIGDGTSMPHSVAKHVAQDGAVPPDNNSKLLRLKIQ